MHRQQEQVRSNEHLYLIGFGQFFLAVFAAVFFYCFVFLSLSPPCGAFFSFLLFSLLFGPRQTRNAHTHSLFPSFSPNKLLYACMSES
ncbi:hypothetical protein TRSC58_07433 [Trypanosoma rangeli SC58]|uniref:Uncharacterized protein n=1 Tax=Trypanosoma rangeli SC58 TaxID=429131 RepID=A0A061IT74_TRYRA|nr:hypothetical protein TRSC58_07433 [Trypanosoma rangeli SC58]